MSVLTAIEIINEIEQGRIKIQPFLKENVGSASVDLTLSAEFRVFAPSTEIFDVLNDVDYEAISSLKKRENIVVNPGEMILGLTVEQITLPDDICGWVEGRSRFARLGLTVHITAPFSHPAIDNRIVLEICNLGSRPLRLHQGLKICQFVFQRACGRADFPNDFKNL